MPSVLVIEDDYLLADEIASALQGAGYRVVGPAATLDAANRLLADNKIDFGCLDVRLSGDETSLPMARSLAALGIPFVFLTAYPIAYLPVEMRDRPKLEKPMQPAALVGLIKDLLKPAAKQA